MQKYKNFEGSIFDAFELSGVKIDKMHHPTYQPIPDPQMALLMLNPQNCGLCGHDITDIKKAVIDAICKHLQMQQNSSPPFSKVNEYVSRVCKAACQLLVPNEGEHLEIDRDFKLHIKEKVPRKTPYQFQRRWVENIKYLLPCNDVVMNLLPYLLTSYVSQISKNKLDISKGKRNSRGSIQFSGKDFPSQMAKHFVTASQSISFRALLGPIDPWDYQYHPHSDSYFSNLDLSYAIAPTMDDIRYVNDAVAAEEEI